MCTPSWRPFRAPDRPLESGWFYHPIAIAFQHSAHQTSRFDGQRFCHQANLQQNRRMHRYSVGSRVWLEKLPMRLLEKQWCFNARFGGMEDQVNGEQIQPPSLHPSAKGGACATYPPHCNFLADKLSLQLFQACRSSREFPIIA